jgi:hypothetical protein
MALTTRSDVTAAEAALAHVQAEQPPTDPDQPHPATGGPPLLTRPHDWAEES